MATGFVQRIKGKMETHALTVGGGGIAMLRGSIIALEIDAQSPSRIVP